VPEALPMTYVIDASGVIRAQIKPRRTPLTFAALESVVAPLLAGPTTSAKP
jgi:hypothetical protein